MLETDDVDENFFTPVSSTSLANIFDDSSQNVKKQENVSLKYSPQNLKQSEVALKTEDSNSKCIFACALTGHEWSENAYKNIGMVGFAILKPSKSNNHNIVLYDASKITLSCTPITSSFSITISKNVYIQYYDITNKCWSLCGKENDIEKIISILNNLNVTVKYSQLKDKNPSSILHSDNEILTESIEAESLLNQMAKASILNRVSSMGQSVLPPQPMPKSTDSSESEHIEETLKIKKNLMKNLKIKRASGSSKVLEKLPTNKISEISNSGPLIPTFSSIPLNTNNSFISSDFNCFMSEQRINNTETRIGINRIHDKVDQIINKLNDEPKTNTESYKSQMYITNKLITEYENKIKHYEEILVSKGLHPTLSVLALKSDMEKKEIVDETHSQMTELASKINEKDSIIMELNNEIKGWQLKDKENASLIADMDKETQNKIKKLMNSTYNTICTNFDDAESYSGASIKTIIGSMIKYLTLESINK